MLPFIAHLHIVGLSFILSQRDYWSAIEFSSCKSVFISDTIFQGSGDATGRAIAVKDSEASISRCEFKGLTLTDSEDVYGGVLNSTGSNVTIHGSSFINNVVHYSGGAIFAYESNLLLNKTYFNGNSARRSGGAIGCTQDSQVEMLGNNTFHNNSCKHFNGIGGAMDFD